MMTRFRHILSLVLLVLGAAAVLPAQNSQIVAVRAGRLFDPKSGTNLSNQVVLVSGDRITEVGPADRVKTPAGAKIIDLSQATVLPGLIDGHVHLTDAAGGPQHEMLEHLYTASKIFGGGLPR